VCFSINRDIAFAGTRSLMAVEGADWVCPIDPQVISILVHPNIGASPEV